MSARKRRTVKVQWELQDGRPGGELEERRDLFSWRPLSNH